MGEEEKKEAEEKPKPAEEKPVESKDGSGGEGEKKGGGGGGGGEEKGEAPPPPPPPPEEIVMRVYMHCEGCAKKVRSSLKGFEGVEGVKTDTTAHKVVVKGKKAAEDPMKVVERVKKKTGRKVELLTPLPPPEPEKKAEEEKKEAPPPKPEEKPPVMSVVLKVHMHCEACAQEIKKRILKMKGVEAAEPDLKASQVTVTGVFAPPKLVEYVYRRTGKHSVIVKAEPAEKKAGDGDGDCGEAKDGEKAAEGEKKAEDGGDNKDVGEKKDEKKEGGGEGGGDGGVDEKGKDGDAAAGATTKVVDGMLNEYYHHYPRYGVGYAYPSVYSYAPYSYPPYSYPPYSYPPPQIFSDENPNACSVM